MYFFETEWVLYNAKSHRHQITFNLYKTYKYHLKWSRKFLKRHLSEMEGSKCYWFAKDKPL